MIDWLIYVLPWWVKVIAGLIVVGIILRLFGWKATVAAMIAVATLGLVNRSQQQGWEARIKKDNEDADKAIARARSVRDAADRRNAAPGRLRDDDGFRRD